MSEVIEARETNGAEHKGDILSESRIPDAPLPRPFLRVLEEDKTTRDDVERVRKTMQQSIDALQTELSRERELTRKLEKSGAVLQDILSAPDFRALSMQAAQATPSSGLPATGGTRIDEPPIEYVTVTEIELTAAIVTEKDLQAIKPP